MKKAESFISRSQHLQDQVNELMQEVLHDEEVQQFLAENEEAVNAEVLAKSASKLYEFCREKKKRSAAESNRLSQDFYPRLVLHNHLITVEYLPTQEYVRQNQERLIQSRIQTFHIPLSVRHAKMTDVHATGNRVQAIKQLNTFIQSYYAQKNAFHKGLYLFGEFGVGKSYLFGAFANEFAKKGANVVMVHFPTFIVDIKQSMMENKTAEKVNVLKQADLLILDDIGAESNTEWTRDDVLAILLQYRMQENLPTFFTSNQSMADLEEHLALTKNSEDTLKAKRIMERVKYLATEVQLGGENLRNP